MIFRFDVAHPSKYSYEIMIFADINLARRIDSFEACGSRIAAEAAIWFRTQGDAFVKPLGEGVAVYTGPDSHMNKIIGMGFESVHDSQELTRGPFS